MKLVELFADLSRLELRNLSIANEGDGTIAESGRLTVAGYVNDSLRRLYADFPLKKKDVLVLMQSHITNYHLIPRFAVTYRPTGSTDNETFRYLLDLPQEPFVGDLIKILTVFNSSGAELPLNDRRRPDSLFTPEAHVLQVTRPEHDRALSVLYQARHAKLSGELEEEVVIPDILEEALRALVAYKVFSSMNTAVSTAKANEHFQNYTAILRGVVEKDLVSTSIGTTNTRFEAGGWP